MVLLGLAVMLGACSGVSGRTPTNERSVGAPGPTRENRDADPGSPQPEMPKPPQSGLARRPESDRGQKVAEIARKHLRVPYRWGGSTPSGFDCSGFVRYVYQHFGVSLPHNAAQQYRHGTPVPRDNLEPGDLVFFDRLRHNGIYVGDGRFIHARRTGIRVSISRLDEDWYAARWVGARRL